MSEGNRCDDNDKRSDWMMDDKKHFDDGNAAAGTKLPSVKLNKTRTRWSFKRRRRMAATSPLMVREGDRYDHDGERFDGIMGDNQRSDDGNKDAATGTKPPSRKHVKDSKTLSRWCFKRQRMAPERPFMVWIIVVALITLLQLVQCGYITVDVITDEFDLTKHPRDEIFGTIYGIAADAMPWLEVEGHRYLAPKDFQPSAFGGDGSGPGRWIKVPFKGETVEDKATIALSDNDLSLVAFMNNINTWHCFKGYEEMFPNCVVLNSGLDERGEEWDETYSKLIEGGVEKLHTVPLGKKSDLEATRTLGRYRHGITSLAELKNALVRKMLMYPEALKIRVVRETFSGLHWESETYISSTLEQAKLFQYWGKISYFLWRWDREGGQFLRNEDEIRIGQETGTTSPEKALEVYDLLRRPQVVRIKVRK